MAQSQVADLGAYRARRAGVGLEGGGAMVRKPDVASEFSVSVRQVERWVERGMPRKKLGRRLVLFDLAECRRWVDANVE